MGMTMKPGESSDEMFARHDATSADEGGALQTFAYALQESLRSALSSIRAHRMRSFLTMLGVIIGVASVICVVALLQGLTKYVMSEFQGLGGNSLVIAAYTSNSDALLGKWNHLRAADVDQIRQRIGGISNITPILIPTLGAIHSGVNSTASAVYATTSYFQQSGQAYPRYGRFINDNDNQTRRRVVILGEKARTDMKLPENPVGQFIQIGAEWFKIVGVMEPRGEILGINLDNYVIIPYDVGLALSPAANQPDIQIRLTVDDATQVDAVKDRISMLLRRAHKLGKGDEDDFKVQTSQSLISTFSRVSSMITVVVAAIVGISLLVGGVGIMNIMLVSVTERTREIGIAKALGAPRRFILTQFLIEAMLLAVIGGLLGIGFGYLCSLLAAAIIPGFPPPVTPWWAIAGATGFSALVGIIFGMLPATKAANLAPIDALRHE